jgi:two-component system, OmpR family, sensor kinase
MDGEVQLYVHPTPIDLLKLLREACHLQREITPHGQILESLCSKPVRILGDSNLLLQVFGNLLSNAVKYSPGLILIKVTCELQGSEVLVGIEDRGIGILEADSGRIFERYYRGSNVSGIVGTGIGLYFVKTVVELHGGQVTATNLATGGSRFMVRLPLEQPQTVTDPDRAREHQLI